MTKVLHGIFEKIEDDTWSGLDETIGINSDGHEVAEELRGFVKAVRGCLSANGSIKGHRVRVKSVWTPGFAKIAGNPEPVLGYLWDLKFTVDKKGLNPNLFCESFGQAFLHDMACLPEVRRQDPVKNRSGIVEIYSNAEGTDPSFEYTDFTPVPLPYELWLER
jgi:hypothetical protein